MKVSVVEWVEQIIAVVDQLESESEVVTVSIQDVLSESKLLGMRIA